MQDETETLTCSDKVETKYDIDEAGRDDRLGDWATTEFKREFQAAPTRACSPWTALEAVSSLGDEAEVHWRELDGMQHTQQRRYRHEDVGTKERGRAVKAVQRCHRSVKHVMQSRLCRLDKSQTALSKGGVLT